MTNEDVVFINLVASVAARHGCSITDVDMENRLINLDGSPDDEEACAIELASLLEGRSDVKENIPGS
jgi:hypothetical protein